MRLKRWIFRAASVLFLSVLGIAVPAQAEPDPTVTLALDRASLTKVAQELTRQTGQKYVAVDGVKQKVVIFCKEQPASRVRAALSELLGWSWSRGESGGKAKYTLLKSLQLTKQEEALRKRFWAQYSAILSGMVTAAANAKGDGREGSPLDFQVHDPVHGGVLRSLGSLPEEARASILEGIPYVATGKRLPRAERTAIDQLLDAHASNGGSHTSVLPGDTVRLEIVKNQRNQPSSLQLSVWRDGRLRLQFNSAQAELAQAESRGGGDHVAQIRQSLRDNPELTIRLGKMPPLEWPQPPNEEPSFIGWQLREMSRRTDLALIADCYPEAEQENTSINHFRKPWPLLTSDGQPLYAAFGQICEQTGYDWRVREKWAYLRYRQWYWEPLRTTPAHPVSSPNG